jgi:two-component system response regulator AtoC
MPLQVKLLRVLQERKIRRLGGISDIPVQARIISATNRDLETLVKEGRFREDLYYRLNVFRIFMPPLRDRREDIPLFAEHFLARRRRGEPHTVTPEAMKKLQAWSYPGNIRELENILERALIYCRDNRIREEDIDLHGNAARAGAMSPPPEGGGTPDQAAETGGLWSLDEIEKQAIAKALESCEGNRTKAAEKLGISRKTILNKIKEYGLK